MILLTLPLLTGFGVRGTTSTGDGLLVLVADDELALVILLTLLLLTGFGGSSWGALYSLMSQLRKLVAQLLDALKT